MFTNCPHKQICLDTVKEGLDVEIKDPGVAPASLPCDAHSIERRFAGPVSIGVVMEVRLHEWLQNPFDHHLGDSIGDRWHGHGKLHNSPNRLWVWPRSPIPFIRSGVSSSRF